MVAAARHARQEGAAHRPRLRRPGRGAELVRLRLSQGGRLHRREGAAGTVRRGARQANARLLDPGQLHDGDPAGGEHADHSDRPVRRREVPSGPAADAGGRHPSCFLRRRQAGGAPVPRQHPPGARHGDGEGAVRRPVGLRRRPGGQLRHGGLHPSRSEQDLQQGPRLWLEERPNLARLRRARSPIRSIATSCASSSGGLAIDVPNGKYHVFVNMDSPSGYWGEFQRYRRRALILEGVRIVDTMDLGSFKKRYFRFWDADDLPTDNTFDKYQLPYFKEKHYEVDSARRAVEHRFRGRELGLRRLGHRGLSRRESRAGQALPRIRPGPPALPLRQHLQARAAQAERRDADHRRRATRSAASSPSTATG